MKKFIGLGLIGLPFFIVGLLAYTQLGFLPVVMAFGLASFFTLCIFCGVKFMMEG